MDKTCFVVMPIGTQRFGSLEISAHDLLERYTDLVPEAISRARPSLTIVRADDIAGPGAITSDVFTHLMHAKYVVGDVTFPNPNVFYELEIDTHVGAEQFDKERRSEQVPFDFLDLRHIEYDNTPKGLKVLEEKLREHFDWLDLNPGKADNRFLELALTSGYEFPTSSKAALSIPVQVGH